jgi:hypothetical protein
MKSEMLPLALQALANIGKSGKLADPIGIAKLISQVRGCSEKVVWTVVP